MVEGTALEKRHTGNGIESSNLSLSARKALSMSTKKTLQQQISRDSVTALKYFFEVGYEWIVSTIPQEDDFGTDGQILIFENGSYNQQKLDFQLKSTGTATHEVSIDREHLDMWRMSGSPFFLFFWNKSENKIYFLNFHDYYDTLSRINPEKLQQENILIEFIEELDNRSIEDIKRTVYKYNEIAVQAIHEHQNKTAHIENFLRQGRIIAMGYSFAGYNFKKQSLRGAVLMGANFEKAILSNSDMRRVSAMGTNFNGANLRGSDLRGASVMGAYFENTGIQEAKLEGAMFMGAFLSEADFRGASFDELSLWSISQAFDFEKAKFDDGVLEKIQSLTKINNYSFKDTALTQN